MSGSHFDLQQLKCLIVESLNLEGMTPDGPADRFDGKVMSSPATLYRFIQDHVELPSEQG